MYATGIKPVPPVAVDALLTAVGSNKVMLPGVLVTVVTIPLIMVGQLKVPPGVHTDAIVEISNAGVPTHIGGIENEQAEDNGMIVISSMAMYFWVSIGKRGPSHGSG